MSVFGFIVLGVAVLLIGYLVILYNNLVALKHRVAKAWANIDVLLKQRHDELPKLVETCKRYMSHEQETLEKVISARNSVASANDSLDMGALGEAETQLRSGLDQSFQHLQSRISDLENGIADRRELYNNAVNLNNTRIEQFPDVLIARRFNFKAHELLEFSEEEIADVNMQALFNS